MGTTNFKSRLKSIKGLLFDVDGVLTDNQVLLMESGQLARSMSIRDGYALRRAVEEGLIVGIISGGGYGPIRTRLEKLGVKDVELEVEDKEGSFRAFLQKHGLEEEEVLFMGDDVPDLPILKRSGLSTCPYDAVRDVRPYCSYVSDKKGGEGCVRDIIEQVLRAKELWGKEKG